MTDAFEKISPLPEHDKTDFHKFLVRLECSILGDVHNGSVVRLLDTPNDGDQNCSEGRQHQLKINVVVKHRD